MAIKIYDGTEVGVGIPLTTFDPHKFSHIPSLLSTDPRCNSSYSKCILPTDIILWVFFCSVEL